MGPSQSAPARGAAAASQSADPNNAATSSSSRSRRNQQQGQAVVSVSVFEAITSGDTSKLELLLGAIKAFNVNDAGADGNPTLHHAVQGTVNTCEMVKLLLKKGALINGLNKDGETPLIIAVSADREDVVQLLLSRGADVDTPSTDGGVPLSYALVKRCRAVLPALLKKRPNVNFLTEKAENILHASVLFGDAGVVSAVVGGLRIFPGGRIQFPPPAAEEPKKGDDADHDSTLPAENGEAEEGEKWTHTASLLDARTLSKGDCPIALATHTALNGSNSISVRAKATEVGQFLSTVRTDMLLEDHLDLPRS